MREKEKRVLILGCSGMFGTAVEQVCRNRNIEYIGLSHKDIEITRAGEIKAAVEKYRPDAVINTVAIVGVNIGELKPELTFAVNTIAVSNLAKICQEKEICLLQCSTHAVFDGRKDGYYTEEDQPNPTNIYGASKYMSECLVMNLSPRHYIARFPTMFGLRRNDSLGFVDKVLVKIKKNEVIRIADDKIDSPTFAFDAAEAVISLMEKNSPYGLYHIANAGRVSYYDFVSKILEILRIDNKLIRAKDRDFESLGLKPLKTALKSVKLEPMRSWQQALTEYLNLIK